MGRKRRRLEQTYTSPSPIATTVLSLPLLRSHCLIHRHQYPSYHPSRASSTPIEPLQRPAALCARESVTLPDPRLPRTVETAKQATYRAAQSSSRCQWVRTTTTAQATCGPGDQTAASSHSRSTRTIETIPAIATILLRRRDSGVQAATERTIPSTRSVPYRRRQSHHPRALELHLPLA